MKSSKTRTARIWFHKQYVNAMSLSYLIKIAIPLLDCECLLFTLVRLSSSTFFLQFYFTSYFSLPPSTTPTHPCRTLQCGRGEKWLYIRRRALVCPNSLVCLLIFSSPANIISDMSCMVPFLFLCFGSNCGAAPAHIHCTNAQAREYKQKTAENLRYQPEIK